MEGKTTTVSQVKQRLNDVKDPNSDDSDWAQGYVTALTDYGLITESEHDGLLSWIVEQY